MAEDDEAVPGPRSRRPEAMGLAAAAALLVLVGVWLVMELLARVS